MTLKEKIHRSFLNLQKDKATRLQAILDDLFESAKNETKSTAGDKHETALAHLQAEQQNIGAQLADTNLQTLHLKMINPLLRTTTVGIGSIVCTAKNYFFICAGLGKIMLDGTTIIAISDKSPLGQQLMGKQAGTTVQVNGIKHTIEKII